jgi:hypothetical protein
MRENSFKKKKKEIEDKEKDFLKPYLQPKESLKMLKEG